MMMMNKWYMHKQEPFEENETDKILSNFELQADHQIPARSPDLVIIKKRKKEKRLDV